MNLHKLTPEAQGFRTNESVQNEIKAACENHPALATFHKLGESEEGRDIYGVVLGNGKQNVSLLAGAHSDEPVGPETLRNFILNGLTNREAFADLFAQFQFVIVPHVNPDGEARNQVWIKNWPSPESYLGNTFRELPGRDIEFGYPKMRVENHLVSLFLRNHAPFDLHMSLHGMGYSDGLFLLIERHWLEKTKKLQADFCKIADDLGLRLHDHDRKGDKGFQYIGPGFTTTPEGTAMRAYFENLGDHETADKFHQSSMEFVRSLGGTPLCLVTELPLFLIQQKPEKSMPGVPKAYLEFKKELPSLRAKLLAGNSISNELAVFSLAPFDLRTQIEIQLKVLEFGLECVS